MTDTELLEIKLKVREITIWLWTPLVLAALLLLGVVQVLDTVLVEVIMWVVRNVSRKI